MATLLLVLSYTAAAAAAHAAPAIAIVGARGGGARGARTHYTPASGARPPLADSDATSDALWPAPQLLRRAGAASWALVRNNSAASGSDCPYTAHGPDGSLAVCQAACESAGPATCSDINYGFANGNDCVMRRCADPAHPGLTPDEAYAVYAITRPVLPSYAVAPDFAFVATGEASALLSAAFVRARAAAFAYGPPTPVAARAVGAPPALSRLAVRVLTPDAELRLGADESYVLDVAPASGTAPSTLTAPTVWGALHGLETFAQLVSWSPATRGYAVVTTHVTDAPRFPFRGVMLDASRHYLSISAMQQVVDAMAAVKLNTLSIHFSDDQSWPLVVPSAPLLSLRAAYSNYSHVYSQVDMAAFVSYARARGVRVLPEFDSPSHFGVLAAAYPQYAATAYDASSNSSYLCMVDPSREEVWQFLAGIWRDIAAVFPDAQYRIGGDEIQGCWAASPAVVLWAAQHNITDVAGYYERRAIAVMRGLGKTTLAWLDIHGWPLKNESWARDYPDVTLDVWTGCYSGSWQEDVSAFTTEGGSVVVSGPYYITQQQGVVGPHFTWQQMYRTDLHNFTGNTSAARALVHGGELCVWDDAAQTDSGDLMVSLTPFIYAVGEAWWSPQSATSGVEPDAQRLHHHRCRLIARGLPSHPIYAFSSYCPVEYEVAPLASTLQTPRETAGW